MNLEELKAAAAPLSAQILKPLAFSIPGLGKPLHVRCVTIAESQDSAVTEGMTRTEKIVAAAAHSLCDEHGVRLANTPKETDDLRALLSGWTFDQLNLILSAMQKANGQDMEQLGND